MTSTPNAPGSSPKKPSTTTRTTKTPTTSPNQSTLDLIDEVIELRRKKAQRQRRRAKRLYPTPGAIAKATAPSTVQTPALDVLDQALIDARTGKHPRLIFTMPPQEGKSQRVSRAFPLWLLIQDPGLRIAVVSYSDRLARRWGRAVRNDIKGHTHLGLTVRRDTAAADEWQLEGHDGGMVTVGLQGGLTGRPVDVLIIDDPFPDQKAADSEVYRETVKEWWRTVGSQRLPEHAIIILVQTRWHEDDLAGWLLAEQPDVWRHINIPALADHDPAKGEVDILGREVGEWMLSARDRTDAGWEQRRKDAGSRGFLALHQGRPTPAEGGILKRGWWQYSPLQRAIQRADGSWWAIGAVQVIQSWDCAFKDTDGSDWVVGQVWARRGPKSWLLDQVRDHMDLPSTCDAVVALSAKWPQAKLKLIEDKANGPGVIQSLRKVVPGLVAVTPKDSKIGRANAVAPFIEAENVELPLPVHAPWVSDFVNECASFPNGAHDDQVDACTQALARFYLESSDAADFMNQLEAEGGAPDDLPDDRFPFNRG